MDKSIKDIQQQIVPSLKQAGIKRSSLFGSYARGESLTTSDIDLLIETPEGFTLFDLANLNRTLEDKLQKDVDLVTYRSINPKIKEYVLKDEIQIL